MKKNKNFSYDDQTDQDVIDYLNKQKNYSAYIRELVRQDMNNERITKSDVIKLIEQYMKQEPKSHAREALKDMFG